MIYVPQYSFPTPEGFRDLDFDHYYDSDPASGPLYLPQLSPGPGDPNPILNIPLRIDADAPFLWRGIKFEGTPGLGPDASSPTSFANFGVRLRDPWGNYFCPDNDFVPVWLFGYQPQESSLGLGLAPGNTMEPETECPPQSVVYLDIFSYDTIPWHTGGPGKVWLTGVKRYSDVAQSCGEGSICG